MRNFVFTLLVVTVLVGLSSYVYSENVVSLQQNPDVVLPQVNVDIHLSEGQGVAGYNSFIVFDATVLKYVSATLGDFLSSDGVFIRPLLREDGSYTLALDVDGTTQTGATVSFGEDQLSLSEFFYEIPPEVLAEFTGEIYPEFHAAFLRPGAKLYGLSIVGSSLLGEGGVPVATGGDGALATLTFEVMDPTHPAFIVLAGASLFDSVDAPLETTLVDRVINALSVKFVTDVTGDGEVNILDLVGVASSFGQPISAENAAADVNGDGEINILDLVAVANDFGKMIASEDPDYPDPGPGIYEPPQDVILPEPVDLLIGVVLPLSGHLADIGKRMQSGFALGFSEIADSIPDMSVAYIFVDDTGTAEGAVLAFETLIHEEGVSVILGPGSSSSAQAAFPIAQENSVVAISATAGARGLGAIGDYVFRTALSSDIVISKGVAITQRKIGYQQVATLYDESDLFSSDSDAAFLQALSDNGVEVLDTQTYMTGDTDFTEQLTQIKALNPDALFVSALPPEKPLILIQARNAGISVPIIIRSLTESEVQAAGTAAEGAITFTGWLPTDETIGNQAFVKQYQKDYGTEPNAFAAATYACVQVFAEALKNAENTDAQSMKDALARIQDLDTILGKFSFNEDGDGVYEPNILIVEDGVLRFLD